MIKRGVLSDVIISSKKTSLSIEKKEKNSGFHYRKIIKIEIENIKKYVKPKIFKDFQNAIDERIKEKEKLIIDILTINHTKIKNIKIKGNIVKLEVIFDTVQIKALQDINDEIIDGDLDEKIVVKDMWTFERNFKLQSKNWTLIETSTN